jgi:hypothetical protein
MNTDKKNIGITAFYLCLSVFICGSISAQQAVYQQDFQQTEPGKIPQDFKVLSGEFAVRQEAENRFLELETSHLNSFGLFLGPERGVDTAISARMRSWPTGRRFPEFGVGLGGAGGYQLWLMPAVGELQLRFAKAIVARAPLAWKPGEWVHMRLEVRQTSENAWLVNGKGWLEGASEPADWMIRHEPTTAPPNGRPALWGTPYSEKPIHFDDVRIDGR